MDTSDLDDFRSSTRTWIRVNWNAGSSLASWRTRLLQARLAVPSWPQQWHGRGLPPWADVVVEEELASHGAPGLPLGTAVNLAGPTILKHGSDALRAGFLAPILAGRESWCQLFSEPGAGSDLAGLTARAELRGDQWVVNGQKAWTSNADRADYGLLLARTDWDVPKHRGLTYFALPMKQRGVEVRALRQMNGHSSFDEVFLSSAVIPANFVIGQVGDGWSVAATTLAHERRLRTRPRPIYSNSGRAIVEAEAEADRYFATYSWYPQRFGRIDLVVDNARRAGCTTDAVVRQAMAEVISRQRMNAWTGARFAEAGASGSEGSVTKLLLSEETRLAAAVHALIGGAGGMLSGTDGSFGGTIAEVLVSVPAQSIAGGTDQIQRNILAERSLGLPRETSIDRDTPFRDVPSNRPADEPHGPTSTTC